MTPKEYIKCKISFCGEPVYTEGYCWQHYLRRRIYGNPAAITDAAVRALREER